MTIKFATSTPKHVFLSLFILYCVCLIVISRSLCSNIRTVISDYFVLIFALYLDFTRYDFSYRELYFCDHVITHHWFVEHIREHNFITLHIQCMKPLMVKSIKWSKILGWHSLITFERVEHHNPFGKMTYTPVILIMVSF